MRAFVVPCGTSVLDNLRTGDGCRRSLSGEVQKMRDWAASARINTAGVAGWSPDVPTRVLEVVADAGAHAPRRISAERASLVQVPGGAPVAGDRLVILASDTPDGVLAALVNAAMLGGDVGFASGPPNRQAVEPLWDDGGPRITIVRIEGLLPRDTSGFTAAMERLGRTCRWVRDLGAAQVAVLLTGGYKATVPYVVVLAEYLKGFAGQISAYCLHEGDGGADPPELIEIYLRRGDPGDLAEIEAAEAGQVPPEARLEGFAYERTPDGMAKLTPLGVAVKALLKP